MVQEVDILLHLIDLLNVLLVQRDQSVHGPIEVLAGQRGHTVQLLDHPHHGGGRIKHHLLAYVFKLIALPIVDLPVLPRHTEAGQLHDPVGEGEQHDHLKDLNRGMGICHKAPLVPGYGPDHLHNRLQSHKQQYVQQGRADDVEPEMNQRGPLGILLACHGGQQGRSAGTDVAAQNDIQRNGQLQQILIGQQQHNAHRDRGALDDGGQKQSHQSCHEGILQGGQHVHDLRHLPHARHRAGHGAQSKEQHAEADDDLRKLLDLLILTKHHRQHSRQQNHGSVSRQVEGHKLRCDGSTDICSEYDSRRLIKIHQPRVDKADHHGRAGRGGLDNGGKDHPYHHARETVGGKYLQNTAQLGACHLLDGITHDAHAEQKEP